MSLLKVAKKLYEEISVKEEQLSELISNLQGMEIEFNGQRGTIIHIDLPNNVARVYYEIDEYSNEKYFSLEELGLE